MRSSRVVAGTVDEARLASTQERRADQVHPGRVDDTTVVADHALAVEDVHVEPGVVGAEAGRPDDGLDRPAGEIQAERRRLGHDRRREPVRRRYRVVHAVGRRPLVDGVEQPVELEVGELALVPQRPGELGAAVADAGEAADQLHADAGERVEVERRRVRAIRRAASTARGAPARCRPPRRSARRARRPPPSTSGCPDPGTSRGPRTCSPTASVTGRPERWISWAICTPVADAPTTSTPPSASSSGLRYVHRRERRHRRGHRLGEGGHARHVERARREHDGPALPLVLIGRDAVAAVGAAHRRHRRAGLHRGRDVLRVAGDEARRPPASS